jgi:hypothetical protein
MRAWFEQASVRRKLMTIILFTTGAVVAVTCAAFFAYDLLTFRQSLLRNLATVGKIIASNSTAAVAFDNERDAREVLGALRAEPNVIAACLYRNDGTLFSRYPEDRALDTFPGKPEPDGHRFDHGRLLAFQPITQGSNKRVGTLYLESDLRGLYARFWVYAAVVLVVISVAGALSYLIARALQRRISEPIGALSATAQAVSRTHNYAVRAPKLAGGELGQLTDAFNDMLQQIDEQNRLLAVSERRHRLLFEHSPLPMWVYDLETCRFLAVNDAATVSYGYSREEFLAMTIRDIRPLEDLPALRQDMLETPNGSIYRSPRVWRHRKKDGTIIQVEITSHDLTLDNRAGRLVLANDVTARLRAEADLRATEAQIRQLNEDLEKRIQRRTAQLEAANKELESFSYSVSHDLRAPLRHVQGYVAMLQRTVEGQLSEKALRYLKVINDASAEMGQLIDDLLEFSRMGRTELREGRVPLDELVQDTLRRLEMSTRGRNIVWKIAPLPVVIGDASMLRQVLANLIGNAVKYTRKCEVAQIEIGSAGNEGGRVVLFVRDNGAGFDMNYAHKLFGVFQRLHRADEFEGTGIGLATVRRVVTRHGGRVWAEGAVGKGATFYFTLQRAHEQPTQPETHAT